MDFSYKIGDVFCFNWKANKRYFQFVAIDKAQCDSPVIRVFEWPYYVDENPSVEEIVAGSVFLYAHTAITDGVEKGLWKDGSIATNFYVWHPNEWPPRNVGILPPEYWYADPGEVLPWSEIASRIRYGRYMYLQPRYK